MSASLKLENLTKKYNNRVSVDNLNLEIQPGEIYSLLGENGAGKTTTIGMLTTLIKPTHGEFYIDKFNGVKNPEKIKGSFGVVSQDVAIYTELTAYENLFFIGKMHGIKSSILDDRIAELLTDANLLDRANDVVKDFSGGMQRKLTIAMAMLHNPKILFMDEPTVGLDPKSRRVIWQSLKKLQSKGISIFLTTHYLDEAQYLSNRIGIIRQGKLFVEGSIQDLRDKIHSVSNIEIKFTDSDSQNLFVENFKTNDYFEIITDLGIDIKDGVMLKPIKYIEIGEFYKLVLKYLSDNNISYSSVSVIEPNLEDIFIAITSIDELKC